MQLVYREASDYAKEASKPIFKANKILSVFNLYPYHILLEAYKVLKFRIPYCVFDLFNKKSPRRANNGLSFIIPKTRLSIEKSTFIYQSIKCWNSVYKSLLTPTSINIHKDCQIKGSHSRTTAVFYDYSTPISTFKLKLRNFLTLKQHSGSTEEWSQHDTLLHAH